MSLYLYISIFYFVDPYSRRVQRVKQSIIFRINLLEYSNQCMESMDYNNKIRLNQKYNSKIISEISNYFKPYSNDNSGIIND